MRMNIILLTFIVDIQAAEYKFHTLKCLAQGLMVMTNILLWTFTEWQRKIRIGLLSIVIRTDSVHP